MSIIFHNQNKLTLAINSAGSRLLIRFWFYWSIYILILKFFSIIKFSIDQNFVMRLTYRIIKATALHFRGMNLYVFVLLVCIRRAFHFLIHIKYISFSLKLTKTTLVMCKILTTFISLIQKKWKTNTYFSNKTIEFKIYWFQFQLLFSKIRIQVVNILET